MNKSFGVAAPTLWNALPVSLRSIKCVSTFQSNLKTYLLDIKYVCIFLIFVLIVFRLFIVVMRF